MLLETDHKQETEKIIKEPQFNNFPILTSIFRLNLFDVKLKKAEAIVILFRIFFGQNQPEYGMP